MAEIIGQALGLICVLLGFINYQVKTRKKIIYINLVTVVCFCVHYLLIGAYVGAALNGVAILRNIVYHLTGNNAKHNKISAILFTIVMGAIGVLSWEGAYSALAVAGLMINTFCMSFQNPNNLRKSILVSCPLVLLYNCFVLSVGGIVYESVGIVSAVIGLIRYNKPRVKNNLIK